MVEFKPGACVLLATSKLGRFQPTPAGRESTLLQCARACSPPPRPPLFPREPPASTASNLAPCPSPSPSPQLRNTRRLDYSSWLGRLVIPSCLGDIEIDAQVHLAQKLGALDFLCRRATPFNPPQPNPAGSLTAGSLCPEGTAPAPREALDSLSSACGGRGHGHCPVPDPVPANQSGEEIRPSSYQPEGWPPWDQSL